MPKAIKQPLFDSHGSDEVIVHTDGGSRGNPGPSAIGVVIKSSDGSLKKSYGEYIGETTNNEAEYKAAIFALKKLKQLAGKETAGGASVEVLLDSELVAKQMNGHYKIVDKNMQLLFVELWNLRLDFGNVAFRHISREDNHDADKLVNAALDKELNKLL